MISNKHQVINTNFMHHPCSSFCSRLAVPAALWLPCLPFASGFCFHLQLQRLFSLTLYDPLLQLLVAAPLKLPCFVTPAHSQSKIVLPPGPRMRLAGAAAPTIGIRFKPCFRWWTPDSTPRQSRTLQSGKRKQMGSKKHNMQSISPQKVRLDNASGRHVTS